MQRRSMMNLGLLASLYLSQGIPHGFFQNAARVIFRERGLSLEQIGMTSLLSLPWVFKLFAAPLVDRFGFKGFGRRRSWIIPLQLFTVALILLMSGWGEGSSLTILMVVIFAINLATSIQDVATDGYAVELLTKEERGWGNGIQVGGYRFGFIFGGGVILILHDYLGWHAVFMIMAAVLALAVVPVSLRPESNEAYDALQAPDKPKIGFFKRPFIWRILGALFLYRMIDGFIQPILYPMLVDMGFGLKEVGWLMGIVGTLAAMVGAIIGGALVNRIGRLNALIWFGGLQLFSAGAFLGITYFEVKDWSLLVAAVVLHQIVLNMATVAVFTLMMDWSSKERAGRDYTFQDCTGVFAIIAASILSHFLAQAFGYAGNFAFTMVLTLVAMVSVTFLLRPLLAEKNA